MPKQRRAATAVDERSSKRLQRRAYGRSQSPSADASTHGDEDALPVPVVVADASVAEAQPADGSAPIEPDKPQLTIALDVGNRVHLACYSLGVFEEWKVVYLTGAERERMNCVYMFTSDDLMVRPARRMHACMHGPHDGVHHDHGHDHDRAR